MYLFVSAIHNTLTLKTKRSNSLSQYDYTFKTYWLLSEAIKMIKMVDKKHHLREPKMDQKFQYIEHNTYKEGT